MSAQAPLLTTAFLVIMLTAGPVDGQGLKSCEWKEASCGCMTDQGLISLKAYENGIQTKEGTGGEIFYWNPCKDFTKDGLTAACMQYYNPSLNYDCGAHKNMDTSVTDDGYAMFTMMAGDDVRESKVACVCGSSDILEFIDEKPDVVYNFKLESNYCCPGYSGGGSSKGLSGGSILLIGALCLVFVYVAGGFAIQTFVRKAEGKERIPNLEFWSALPLLILDGFKFTLSCGKSSSYARI